MSAKPSATNRRMRWAACAVAVAAAVGVAPATAQTEFETIEQIQRYCSTSWRNAGIDRQDWPDCTQQALLELLERVSQSRLGDAIDDAYSVERRELNRTVWRTIQRWRRSPKTLPYFDDSATENETASRADGISDAWVEVLAVSRHCLSPRQQHILELTRDGWRVNEIADKLQISTARVSDEKYKAITKLRHQMLEQTPETGDRELEVG